MGARDNLNFGRHIISGGGAPDKFNFGRQIINILCGYNMALIRRNLHISRKNEGSPTYFDIGCSSVQWSSCKLVLIEWGDRERLRNYSYPKK